MLVPIPGYPTKSWRAHKYTMINVKRVNCGHVCAICMDQGKRNGQGKRRGCTNANEDEKSVKSCVRVMCTFRN